MRLDVSDRSVGRIDERYSFLVNGTIASDVRIWGVPGEIILHLKPSATGQLLLDEPLDELLRCVHVLEVSGDLVPDRLTLLEMVRFGRERFEVRFDFYVNPEEWRGEWSMREYADSVRAAVAADTSLKFDIGNDATEGFSILPALSLLPGMTLRKWLQAGVDRIQPVLAHARQRVEEDRSDQAVFRFDFPEPVRAACNQYLVYFTDFLADVGIKATADITTDTAGTVLFAVTPASGTDALAKVRDALHVYLRLPGSDLTEIPNDIESQRLVANVRHLEGQLALVKAMAVTQQKTIDAQGDVIARQRRIAPSLFQDSLIRDEREELFDGTVAITNSTLSHWLRPVLRRRSRWQPVVFDGVPGGCDKARPHRSGA